VVFQIPQIVLETSFPRLKLVAKIDDVPDVIREGIRMKVEGDWLFRRKRARIGLKKSESRRRKRLAAS
jgi:hypothetical protein